ncbi:Oidioi.mRNA.OKI2018_I69.chr1.g649.t1.cds [Oikopleura dioica]|uniref:Oidioi.mRNA.OKI2018_I69.chr1.g649.t1.cds n=1 Tax=Oikopleura dioica TaxID=34765 RepID=A0ABN7SP56_OIKDI|nr:Oidioi.mRNA.OKI2018_I69.chr1.g649.t1.cds [Oikopleura dioica]
MLARASKQLLRTRISSNYVLARVVDGELQEAKIDLTKTSSTKDTRESYGFQGSIWAEVNVNNSEMFAQVGEVFSKEASGRLGKIVSDKNGESCIHPLDVPIEEQKVIEFDLADVNEEQLVRTKNTRYQFDTVKDQDGFIRAVNIHRLPKSQLKKLNAAWDETQEENLISLYSYS